MTKLVLMSRPKVAQLGNGRQGLSESRAGPSCSAPCIPHLSLYWGICSLHVLVSKVGPPQDPGWVIIQGLNFRGSAPCAEGRLRHLCQLQLPSHAGVCAHQRQPASGYPPPISGRSAPSFLLGPPQHWAPQGSPCHPQVHKNFQGPATLAGISAPSMGHKCPLFLQNRGSTAHV